MNNVYIFSIQTLQLFRNQYLYTMYLLFRFWVYVSHKTFEQTYLHKWPNGIDIAGLQQLFDRRMQYFKNPPEVHTPVITHQICCSGWSREKISLQSKKFRQISSRLSFLLLCTEKNRQPFDLSVYITNQILDGHSSELRGLCST